jgi:Kdo2-lipid IVA lauroyltransferase/acyltransferase
MSRDSVADYWGCILFKALACLTRVLPIRFALFLGRRVGDLIYFLDYRHRSLAYSNIRRALGSKLNCRQARALTRAFYQSFGQSLSEVFFMPFVDKKYIEKYVTFEGLEHIRQAFAEGKGVIFLAVHAGSWELSNVICASLGFDFNLLVRDQRHPRLNDLLNKYRSLKGCKIIQRENQTRELVEVLKRNESIGMTMDQGGKTGELVSFFNKEASMATGAVRLALKYDSVILPAYYTRVKGPFIKTVIKSPFKVKKSGDLKKDVHDNLQELALIFEKEIERFPRDFYWPYKIWKYGRDRSVLIISDGKIGHLRQSQALARILGRRLLDKGMRPVTETVEVRFKSRWHSKGLIPSSFFSGKYQCQGCLACLKVFLAPESYRELSRLHPDFVVSCGSSVASLNYLISAENKAKSIVLMRPGPLSLARFDLVVAPSHDRVRRIKNVVVTEAALNLIDEEYLLEHSRQLINARPGALSEQELYLGLLIGGDAGRFRLAPQAVEKVLQQAKEIAAALNAGILVTTSRRTSPEVAEVVKKELKEDPRCKLLVIVHEQNIPQAMGGLLGLSRIVICSPESISMISEAVSSKRYVFVFEAGGLKPKHRRFLEHFSQRRFIYLAKSDELCPVVQKVWAAQPAIQAPDDTSILSKAIDKIL